MPMFFHPIKNILKVFFVTFSVILLFNCLFDGEANGMLVNMDKDYKCLDAYRKQYPGDESIYLEPGGEFIISYGKGHEHAVIEPENETVETFMDRLERSKKAGRNLFYEEWELFEHDPHAIY